MRDDGYVIAKFQQKWNYMEENPKKEGKTKGRGLLQFFFLDFFYKQSLYIFKKKKSIQNICTNISIYIYIYMCVYVYLCPLLSLLVLLFNSVRTLLCLTFKLFFFTHPFSFYTER